MIKGVKPYRTPPHIINKQLPKARPNFGALWTILMEVAAKINHDKLKAILTNHNDKQEYICRKFGVICAADIERVTKKFQKSIGNVET